MFLLWTLIDCVTLASKENIWTRLAVKLYGPSNANLDVIWNLQWNERPCVKMKMIYLRTSSNLSHRLTCVSPAHIKILYADVQIYQNVPQ